MDIMLKVIPPLWLNVVSVEKSQIAAVEMTHFMNCVIPDPAVAPA